MSPWTIRNKPIKPKDRLKILLMVIFWSDPSKYPSPMVRSISNTASEPICPSRMSQNNSVQSPVSEQLDPWNEFSATIFRTMPSMTRISENELHPSKSELCKNTSSRYEQTISTEKSWCPRLFQPLTSKDADLRSASCPVLAWCLPFLFISFTFKVFNFNLLQFWSFWWLDFLMTWFEMM